MKPEALAQKTHAIMPLLCCPLCGEAFSLAESRSLICAKKHCFDLSRRGYINLAPTHTSRANPYDAPRFESRRHIFQDGFYAPVMQALSDCIARHMPNGEDFSLLDAGCGEGSYAHHLAARFTRAGIIGVDLSREAIMAAARRPGAAHFLVGNLSRLPIRDHSLDFLLDVLTPADYTEFRRVLAPNGLLLKVIPGNHYLSEIRTCIETALQSDDYDNARVVSHLQKHATILERITIHHTQPVTPVQAAHFVRMTPMTFGLSPALLDGIHFSEITIHLELLLCRMTAANSPACHEP